MNREERERYWLGKLAKLNPATGTGSCSGKAPHKPLLLLCLLDLAECGELVSRVITRTPGLVLRFRAYGAIVADRWPHRLELKLPFYHLKTQGFWVAFDLEMRLAASPDTCAACELHSEFFDLLSDPGFRVKARIVVISKYFTPTERLAFFESLGIQGGGREDAGSERVMEEAEEAAKRKGRCARFAVRVCSEYRFTCALTGYRCVTADGGSIVEAAHIEQWAKSQNDDVTNGLALSKSAHWMFDAGLWMVDDQFRVLVNSRRFTEQGPDALRLGSYAGRHLQFDPSAKLRPNAASLRAHRTKFGAT